MQHLKGMRPGLLALALGFFVVSLLRIEIAEACASCGSGAGSPLILFPNEERKVYLGVSLLTLPQTVGPDGKVGADESLDTKWTPYFAAGHAIHRRFFMTFGIPYVINARDDEVAHDWGDPRVQLQYTLIAPDLSRPWIPQVQLVFGRKFALGSSIRDRDIFETTLNVTGSGTSENEWGVDVWSGMGGLKWGVAQSFLEPTERTFAEGLSYEPGWGSVSVATLGVSREGLGKVVGGLTHLERGRIRIAGTAVDNSETRLTSAFVTLAWWLSPLVTLRLTMIRNGLLPLFDDGEPSSWAHNGSRNWSFTLAWMKAWPKRD